MAILIVPRRLSLFYLLMLPVISSQTKVELVQVEKWAEAIGEKIWWLVENITGFEELRKDYEESLKEVKTVDIQRLLRDSATKMEQYFSKKIESLQRIKARAEKAYRKLKNESVSAEDVKYVNMININSSTIPVSLAYDQRFKKAVNTSYSGIQIPANVYHKGPNVLRTIKWTAELDEVFIDNLREKDPTLKWQYFGSHDAVFRTYPAKIWKNPHYSARRRPWYTQGAASPKNVVILIDSSGSMVGKTAFIARLAVANLIDTLSENDFFNILYFNTKVRSLSCNRTLVQATKRNREWFKNKLSSSGSTNSANWKIALTEAFQILKKPKSGADCQKIIMIFSDGTEHKYEEVFNEYNDDKKIRVFTYLVGTPSHPANDLIWMACSNKGYYYRVPTVGAIRDLIEDYVSVLSRPMAVKQLQTPVWTNVYRDASGLGMMVTGTLPVFDSGSFLGVCGMDVTIEELKDVVYQPLMGPDGYCFLINNNGHIVKHPNLRSMLGYVESTGDVDLTVAEFVPNEDREKLLNLRKKMLSVEFNETQEATLNTFSFTDYNYYFRAFPVRRHYIFTKLRDTPFSLGIASSQFGYEIKQFRPFTIDYGLHSNNGTLFLDNWQYCANMSLPQKTKDEELRRLLLDKECNASTTSRNLLLDINITRRLESVWKSKKSEYLISLAFVKTHWGLLRVSEDISTNPVTDSLVQRVCTFHTDYVLVTAPYNQGGTSNVTDPSLLVSRGVKINVSNLPIVPAVSGFQMNEENFVKDFLKNASLKDSYHVYLLDENAFIISSSLNTSSFLKGQFLGSVDWELMGELEKGDNPLYKRFTFRNEQGECLKSSSKTSSSSVRYSFYSTLATFLSSWTKKVLVCILQMNFYNWIFVDANTQSATDKQKTNRSCVTNMTTYYANITDRKSFSGNTSCLDCGDADEIRHFFVAPVPRTNLVLVTVENLEEKAIFQYTKKTDGIPGRHTEIPIDSKMCQSNSNLYRRPPGRCAVSKQQENSYGCGEAKLLKPNIFLVACGLFFTASIVLLNRKNL